MPDQITNQEELPKTPLPSPTPKSKEELAHLRKWQNRLLPFMIGVPTLLAGFFIYLATAQMMRFNQILEVKPDSTFIGSVIPSATNSSLNPSLTRNMEYVRWVTLTHMEQESLYKRYNQGGLLLMSRIFTKYLGFFTGMILAIVGAVFIISKLSEDYTSIGGSFSEHAKFNVVSSSPGIIFGVLGTLLMLSTILMHTDITVTDQPLYLNSQSIFYSRSFDGSLKDSSAASQKTHQITSEDQEGLYEDPLEKVQAQKQATDSKHKNKKQ